MVRLIAAIVVALSTVAAQAQDRFIVMASTTSTEQSGLFAHLLPAFRAASGIDIRVVAQGTGQALDTGRRGDADVVFVHDPAAEEKFVAEGFGVDPKVLTDVISKSSGSTFVMEHMHPVPGLVAKAPANRDYAPGFTTDLMAKDLGLAVNAARELRVPVVVAPAAQQVLRLASSHGYGRKDFSSVYEFLRPSSDQAPV